MKPSFTEIVEAIALRPVLRSYMAAWSHIDRIHARVFEGMLRTGQESLQFLQLSAQEAAELPRFRLRFVHKNRCFGYKRILCLGALVWNINFDWLRTFWFFGQFVFLRTLLTIWLRLHD